MRWEKSTEHWESAEKTLKYKTKWYREKVSQTTQSPHSDKCNSIQKRWHHKNTFLFVCFCFCILAFGIPCIGGAWWKTSTAQIWWESVHGGPMYGPVYIQSSVWATLMKLRMYWNQHWCMYTSYVLKSTLISMGLIRHSCGHISGHHEPIHSYTMNQFMSNLVCEGFSSCSTKYGHENAKIQKRQFDDVTLQYDCKTIDWMASNNSTRYYPKT